MTDIEDLLNSLGCPRQVIADWYSEHGMDGQEFLVRPPWIKFDAYRFLGVIHGGRGRGSGIGSGIGRGSGIGSGSGNGWGSGSGRGIGSGIGSGRGSGSGRGIGSGIGIGSGTPTKLHTEKYMRIGKNYIVHLGDWHTFVGRCTEQLGPLTYALADASKISDTNSGDNWHRLAAGDKQARDAATYLHCETELIVPLSIAAIEWVGELPDRK